MARKGSFEFEIKAVTNSEELDKLSNQLNNFYKKYDNKEMKVKTPDFREAIKSVQDLGKAYDDYLSKSKTSSAYTGLADKIKADLDEAQSYFRETKAVLENGDVVSGLNSILDAASKNVHATVVDLGGYVDSLYEKISDFQSRLYDLRNARKSVYDSLGFNADTFDFGGILNTNELYEQKRIIEGIVPLLKEFNNFHPGAYSESDIDSFRTLAENSSYAIEQMQKYNLETTEQLALRQELIHIIQQENYRDSRVSRIKGDIASDKTAYDEAIQDINDYISKKERAIQTIKEYDLELFSNDDISKYIQNAQQGIERYKLVISDLTDYYNKIWGEGKSGGNLTPIVNSLNELKETISSIKSSLEPISKIFENEGNAMQRMADNGVSSFSTLSEAVNALYNNLVKVEQAVDSISTKDFNITNITQSNDTIKASDLTNKYRSSAKELYSQIDGLLQDIVNQYSNIQKGNISNQLRADLSSYVRDLMGFDSLFNKKDLNASSLTKIQDVFQRLQQYKQNLVTFINSINNAIPETFTKQYKDILDPKAIQEEQLSKVTEKVGESTAAVDNNKLEATSVYLQKISEALVSIQTALDPLTKAFSSEDSFFNKMASGDTSFFDSLINKLNEASKLINETSGSSGMTSVNSNGIENATDAIKKEGEAAEDATFKKEKFTDANKNAAISGKETASGAKEAANGIKAEGEAAEQTAKSVEKAANSLDKVSSTFIGNDDEPTKRVEQWSKTTKDAYRTVTETFLKNEDGGYDNITTVIVDDMKKLRDETAKTESAINKAKSKVKEYLEAFKNKTSGRANEISGYEELSNLKISSMDDIETAIKLMNNLNAEYNKIVANFRGGQLSLNPFVNAMNGINNMDVALNKIQISYKNLLNPSEELQKAFDELEAKMQAVQDADNIYAQSEAYGKWQEAITRVNNLLDVELRKQKDSYTQQSFGLDLERQITLIGKQEAQWKKNGQLTDEVKQKINELSDALTNVSNSSELAAWKKQWMMLKDEVMTTKYEIEAAKKAQSSSETESQKYWNSAFKESVSGLVTQEKRPELEQLKASMLQDAEQTKEIVLERYDAIMTIITNKNAAMQKLMSAKGENERNYWQNQYSAWYGAWNALDSDDTKAFFEDTGNAAIIGAKGVEAFNKQLELSNSLTAKESDKQTASIESLYKKQAESIAKQEKYTAQLGLSSIGEEQKKVIQEKLEAEKKTEEELQRQIESYGSLYNEADRLAVIEERRKKTALEIREMQAKESDKQNKQASNYGKSATNSATKKYKSTMDSYEDISSEFTISDKFQSAINNYTAKYKQLLELRQKFESNPNLAKDDAEVKKFDSLAFAVEKARKKVKGYIDDVSKLKQAQENDTLIGATKEFDPDKVSDNAKALKTYINSIADGKVQITGWDAKNKEMYGTIDKGKGVIEQFTAVMDGNINTMYAYRTATKNTGTVFERFFSGVGKKAKEIGTYLIGGNTIYKAISEVRKGIQYVKEIDSALTELKKVTDETDATYAQFLKTMSQTGAEVGATVKDLTNMAANWARLGSIIKSAPLCSNT